MSANPEVALLMGSKSDLPNLKGTFDILRKFNIPFTARIMSAHRTPETATKFASSAEGKGLKIIICAAGMAAHLSGVIAAHTTLPVIGIPMACEPFNGLDALLATVQMPPGIPVASVTTGKAGSKNAALLAVSILALSSPELSSKLKEFRKEQQREIELADSELREDISAGRI